MPTEPASSAEPPTARTRIGSTRAVEFEPSRFTAPPSQNSRKSRRRRAAADAWARSSPGCFEITGGTGKGSSSLTRSDSGHRT
ncbi:MAG TPA: hypothetical protein VGM10_33855 [Actinocrinis sp.]